MPDAWPSFVDPPTPYATLYFLRGVPMEGLRRALGQHSVPECLALLDSTAGFTHRVVVPSLIECLRNYVRWPQRKLASDLGLRVPVSRRAVSPSTGMLVPESRIAHRPGQPVALAGEFLPGGEDILLDELVDGEPMKFYFVDGVIQELFVGTEKGWVPTLTKPFADSLSLLMRYPRATDSLFGSIDFVRTERGPVFLEMNPSPGFTWAAPDRMATIAREISQACLARLNQVWYGSGSSAAESLGS